MWSRARRARKRKRASLPGSGKTRARAPRRRARRSAPNENDAPRFSTREGTTPHEGEERKKKTPIRPTLIRKRIIKNNKAQSSFIITTYLSCPCPCPSSSPPSSPSPPPRARAPLGFPRRLRLALADRRQLRLHRCGFRARLPRARDAASRPSRRPPRRLARRLRVRRLERRGTRLRRLRAPPPPPRSPRLAHARRGRVPSVPPQHRRAGARSVATPSVICTSFRANVRAPPQSSQAIAWCSVHAVWGACSPSPRARRPRPPQARARRSASPR